MNKSRAVEITNKRAVTVLDIIIADYAPLMTYKLNFESDTVPSCKIL